MEKFLLYLLSRMKKVLFPGSFDPITNAHIDIIKRLIELGFYVEVGILNNKQKQNMFDIKKREEVIHQIKNNMNLENMNVFSSDKLLVDICEERNISVVGRGLRSVKDFEYEREMEFNNKKLNTKLEYVYLNTQDDLISISSTVVRELISYGADVSHLVPNEVKEMINK